MRKWQATEYLNQMLSHTGFQFSPVSCDSDFPVRIPGIAKAPSTIEWEAVCGEPFNLEGSAPALWDNWRVFINTSLDLSSGLCLILGLERLNFPEQRPTRWIIDDSSSGSPFRGRRGNRH